MSGYALRRALRAGVEKVLAERDAINRINVFPVADGDTGTNLAFTLGALLPALDAPRAAHVGALFERLAGEAIDASRGNSGAIFAQFLQGMGEVLAGRPRATGGVLAEAAAAGARSARDAVAEPREGTMLSVIAAFAEGWRQADAAGAPDLLRGFTAAVERARAALRDTPRQLPVLRQAGVVDAGALGFVDWLEGIEGFAREGRAALRGTGADSIAAVGVDAIPTVDGEDAAYCVECLVESANGVDRGALKSALLALPLTSLVLAGTRERVRVHAHLDAPQLLFDTGARFGTVRAPKVDDLKRQVRAAGTRSAVAVVTDSGADLPEALFEQLPLHWVPVRVSVGGKDYLDRVSLTPRQFYAELRDSPVPPRTSQPPPGDFRRLFEFLLSHHGEVVYVGLSRALSGTLQSGESAAQRSDPARVHVVDSRTGSVALGLLAIDAAECAAAGMDAARIAARMARLRERTRFYAVVRDLSYGVRGGRAPRLALPLSRLFGLMPLLADSPRGRLKVAGAMLGEARLGQRFGERVAKRIDPRGVHRVMVAHCDAAEDAERLLSELRRRVPRIERDWLVEAGSAIGAHAGPGSLVVGVQRRDGLEAP